MSGGRRSPGEASTGSWGSVRSATCSATSRSATSTARASTASPRSPTRPGSAYVQFRARVMGVAYAGEGRRRRFTVSVQDATARPSWSGSRASSGSRNASRRARVPHLRTPGISTRHALDGPNSRPSNRPRRPESGMHLPLDRSRREAYYNIHFPQSQEALRQAQYRLKFDETAGRAAQHPATAYGPPLEEQDGFLFPKGGRDVQHLLPRTFPSRSPGPRNA